MNRKPVHHLAERQKRRLRAEFKKKFNQDNAAVVNALNNISNLSLNTRTASPITTAANNENVNDVDIEAINIEPTIGSCYTGEELSNNCGIFSPEEESEEECQCGKCGAGFSLKNFFIEDFQNDLKDWVTDCKIPMNHVTKMLHILKEYGINVPVDARTLMKTPRMVKTIEIIPGKYSHIGLQTALFKCFDSLPSNYNFPSEIKVNLNIDGLPLSKSSGKQFWPILGWFPPKLFPTRFRPFIIGIYEGNTKPASANEFLKPFVDEFLEIQRNGILYQGKVIKVLIGAIICDAPAKSYITCTKGHTGYHGCSKCIQEGDFINNRMCFPEIGTQMRTDLSFINKLDEDHHLGTSILELLNIGMITQIPLDYMHLVCLGVMKRLLQFWHKGKQDVRIPSLLFNDLANTFLTFKIHIPSEFVRKPRHLSEVDRFKATEFRQILLYTGMVAFKDILKPEIYNNFLHLACAIRILSSPFLCVTMNDIAKKLLFNFIRGFGRIYGIEFITHNVHNLSHLNEDVLIHGCLDNFSAFIPESFMYHIKQKVCINSGKHLQQVVKRMAEEPTYEKKDRNTLKSSNSFSVNEINFAAKSPNNCCLLTNGTYVMISEIYTDTEDVIKFRGFKFNILSTFFLEPINSQCLGINLCQLTKTSDNAITVEDVHSILCKIMVLPHNEDWVVIPLIHMN